MSTQRALTALPDNLLREVEKIAHAQHRDVSAVISEAVDRYVKDLQWRSLKAYGRQRAEERGLRECDVPALIAEVRAEQSR